MQKSSNPASLHWQGGLPAPPSSGVRAFPGLHTPALGEVGAPALSSSLAPQAHLGMGPWVLPLLCHSPSWVSAAASVPRGCCSPGFALALRGDCEWCCITLPVSSPGSLPTVTSFHTSCCF